jgi:hypothetical protein
VLLIAGSIAVEFERLVSSERRAGRLPPAEVAMDEGVIGHPVLVESGQASELMRVAARRAAGLFHATKRTEVVWVDGDSELAVSLTELRVELADGLVRVFMPVRCDQTGPQVIEVDFAIGSPDAPAGLFASTYRDPIGPELIVTAWGEALVAFAWECVLGLVAGVAGATGKDARGNVLVPVEASASRGGLEIVPMARHRFYGSSGLRATPARRVPT